MKTFLPTIKKAFRLFLLPALIFLAGNLAVYYGLVTGRIYFFNAVGIAYLFSTLIFPLFLVVSTLLSVTQWRPFRIGRLKWPEVSLLLVAVFLLSIRVWATHIEPYRLTLHEIPLESDKIKEPIRILHFSDIQAAQIGRWEASVFERIKDLNPDLVLHTGDLLQPVPPASWESEFPKVQELFDSIDPEFGILNIYGNCEATRPGFLESRLHGVETLDGRGLVLNIRGARLRVHGLRFDESGRDAQAIAEGVLKRSATEDFVILMGHSPSFIPTVIDIPIDLCLAGHTHGGQIRFPGLDPILVFGAIPASWARGYREEGRTRFNVSAGVGTEGTEWLPPIRFFCPPEMTLVHLLPSDYSEDSPEKGMDPRH